MLKQKSKKKTFKPKIQVVVVVNNPGINCELTT